MFALTLIKQHGPLFSNVLSKFV